MSTDIQQWLQWSEQERQEALCSANFVYWQEVKRLAEIENLYRESEA